MTYRIKIDPKAARGIRAAAAWKSANVSPLIAARWFNGLMKKINTLRTLPARCPLIAEPHDFPIEIRELLHGRRRDVFRILFTIREDVVTILVVQHGSRQGIDL